ncbi:hypothetical protein JXA80_04465 [bacterium]|nr:hypothetical protein [candidate division CSSED10-310 bacterium]
MSWNALSHRSAAHSARFIGVSCWVICTLALLGTLWVPEYLPFTDYPVHLTLIQATTTPSQSLPATPNYFDTHWLTPYAIPYQVGRIIASVTPIEMTGKILLSLYILLTPISFARLLHAMNSPRTIALGVFPLLLNFNVSWGFLPFLIAIPLILETITCAIRFQTTPSPHRWLALATLLICLFFNHLFGLITATALILAISIPGVPRPPRTCMWTIFSLIPAGLMTILWRKSLQFSAADAVFLQKGIRFAPLSLKLRFLPDYIVSGDPGNLSRAIFLSTCIVMLLRALPTRQYRAEQTTGHSTGKPFHTTAVALSTGILVLYLLCPYSWLTAVWLFNRLAFFLPMTALCLLPARSRLPDRAWIPVMTLLTLWLGIHATQRHLQFSDEARPGIQALHRIPPGQALRFLPSDSRSRFTDHEPYTHFGQYYVLRQHGFVINPFATLVHMPVQYTPEWMAVFAGFRLNLSHTGGVLQANLGPEWHDYYLLRLLPSDTPDTVLPLFHTLASPPSVLYHTGPWLLLSSPRSPSS